MALTPEDLAQIAAMIAQLPISKPVESEWVNGHSRYADSRGLFRVKLVDDFLKTLPKREADKLPCWFGYPMAWQDGGFPTKEAELACRHNLSNRNWIVIGQRMLEVVPVRFVTEAITGADIPWDERTRYRVIPDTSDGFVPNAVSWGWDDADVGPESILSYVQTVAGR